MIKKNKSILFLLTLLSCFIFVSCSEDEDDHNHEDGEETITKVMLTFTPDNGEDAITAIWLDADGDGGDDPVIDEIELEEEVTYVLTMTLANTLGTEDEDITAEISEEADEHMFFFSFTEGYFTDPTGDGNADSREDDAVNYNDMDENGEPIGLSTTWTTGDHQESEGVFNVILKHQPDLKSSTSDATTGGTDLSINFPLEVVEEGHDHEEEEVINEMVLTFTPTAGGDALAFTWFDSDGEGVANPTIDDITLAPNTEYTMALTLANTLGAERENVTEEIEDEDDEHMFFFEFTADIFSDPSGNGNIDIRESDAVNYNDQDENQQPIGLSTTWTTGAATSGASFRVALKHQPDIKSPTSDFDDGGTDIDALFSLSIQ